MTIRTTIVLMGLLATACTKHNPDSCCTTEEQCARFGLSGVTGCESGSVCNLTGACVAPECGTSADCSSSSLPICEGQLCIATCTLDDECVGIAHKPYCANDGVCVSCIESSECTDAAPVCDATQRTCRNCQLDSECASGVCVEANGRCATVAEIIYVTKAGVDAGGCESGTPCATLPYALGQVDTGRGVIRIDGGSLDIGANSVSIATVTIDGSQTTLTQTRSFVAFELASP